MGEEARMGQNSRNEKAQHNNESRFLERANSFYPDSLGMAEEEKKDWQKNSSVIKYPFWVSFD